MTRDDRILEKLSESVASGAPLAVGLRAAATEAGMSALGRSFRTIATQLEKGNSLDKALKPALGQRNQHVPAAIAAGIQSGRLGQVIDGTGPTPAIPTATSQFVIV